MEEARPEQKTEPKRRQIPLWLATTNILIGSWLMFKVLPSSYKDFRAYSSGLQNIEMQMDYVLDKGSVSNEDISGLVRGIYSYATKSGIDPSKVSDLADAVDDLAELSRYSIDGYVQPAKAKTYVSLAKSKILMLEDRIADGKWFYDMIVLTLGISFLFSGANRWLGHLRQDWKASDVRLRNYLGFLREYRKQKKETKEQ